MKLISKEDEEPLRGRVITALGEFTALSVVTCYPVQLGHQAQKDAGADHEICHKNSSYFMKIIVQMGIVCPLAFSTVSTVFPVRQAVPQGSPWPKVLGAQGICGPER